MLTLGFLFVAALAVGSNGAPAQTATPHSLPTPDPDAALLAVYSMDGHVVAGLDGHCRIIPGEGVDPETARLFVTAYVDVDKLCAARERMRSIFGGKKP